MKWKDCSAVKYMSRFWRGENNAAWEKLVDELQLCFMKSSDLAV